MNLKNNVFMVMTDYQLQLALACIKEFHYTENNTIFFYYRKTALIDYLNLNTVNTMIYLFNGIETYKKPRILFGVINEFKRALNHIKSIRIIKRKHVKKIYISIEEEHFLATLSWIVNSNKSAEIVHLEEGTAVHIDPDFNTKSLEEPHMFYSLLKSLRAIIRLVYFGRNHLKTMIGNTYGRANFYNYAVVLSSINLSENLGGTNHVPLNHDIFSNTLEHLFSFNTLEVESYKKETKILLLISDGESDTNPFDSIVYQKILNSIYSIATTEGYTLLLKNHPIYSGYLKNLNHKIPTIKENLPAEYYFTRLKSRLIVVGGNSTSLLVSHILGIPTYSYIDLYNAESRFAKLKGRKFLVSHKITILENISEILIRKEKTS